MSNQQVVAPRASANGFGPRRGERDNKPHSAAKSSAIVNGSKLTHASPSRDRLMYVMAYLVGMRVEVHVKNGSVISGIFHAADTDKDCGVILKMAQITKVSSSRGQKSLSDVVKKPQTMVIPGREVVQILAKDVALTIDDLMSTGNVSEKKKDLMIDSVISQSRHVEERELERWAPDGDDSDCLELETMYGGRKWSRNWDQFETNEVLFGVKSTFNEEIYTTKLVKGPHMRELEMHASQLAREMEGEDTDDLHLAEERGIEFLDDVDVDEELRYSAVTRDNWRPREAQSDSWRRPSETQTDSWRSRESQADSWRKPTETQTDSWRSHQKTPSSKAIGDYENGSVEALGSVNVDTPVDLSTSSMDVDSTDYCGLLTSNFVETKSVTINESTRLEEKKIKYNGEKCTDNSIPDSKPSDDEKASASEDVNKSKSCKTSDNEPSQLVLSGKAGTTTEPANTSLSARPGSSTSNASENVGGISRSSSVASLASDKSSLNPNAKDFKLNPNARSFTPTPSNLRPQAPVVPDAPFYYQPNISPVQHVHTVPMAMGMGAPFGAQQQFVYNPQAGAPLHQAFVPPHAPPIQYGQQMMIGQPQPRPVYYMQTYTPEMQFRGRNF